MTKLIEPIAGENAFGVFLKDEKTTYRALRTAFNAAQASWRSLSETPEALEDREKATANAAAWASLAELCETCLTETSKDLEVMSWFVAAQLHSAKPFENCRDALSDLNGLVEASLHEMHPTPPPAKLKGDTEEARAKEIAELHLRPFVQLFGEVEGTGLLIGPLTNLNLLGEVTFGKIVLAEKNGELDSIRSAAAAHIAAESEVLSGKVEALQEMDRLIQRLDASVKSYAAKHSLTPPLIGYGSRLMRDVLSAAEKMVEGLGFPWPGQENGEADESVHDDVQGGTPDASGVIAAPVQGGQRGGGFDANTNVSNRHDALLAIAQLAKYFRKTEPHSPICLLLDRAVRWGNLNAAELYKEILSDGSVGMSQMALMTGLESQGFSDNFGQRGGSAAGGIEHPTLDNYAAALPVPNAVPTSNESTPAPVAIAPEPVQSAPAQTASTEVSPNEEAKPEADEPNLPMKNFQW